jgi:hypothetical protein
MDKKTTLQTYRDICEVGKNQLISDLNKAVTEGAFAFDSDLDKARFFALLDTLISTTNAQCYEMFVSQLR